MILEKIFIKDHKNIEDENVRMKYGILAGCVGIVSNFILVIIHRQINKKGLYYE